MRIWHKTSDVKVVHGLPDGDGITVMARLHEIRADVPVVLLTGESGTGKTRVAREIHQSSPRSAEAFIPVSCPALPRGLLESELFGHEKGAFTGATAARAGRFEQASKGTIFLDEIGDLPGELQPKLLTVLQDREFFRLGGNHILRTEARVIAATRFEPRCQSLIATDSTHRRVPPWKPRKSQLEIGFLPGNNAPT